MSLTIHDLRVSLRDKSKVIDELERKLDNCKIELNEKERLVQEHEISLQKKDEIISVKDLIIKEKDIYILKLESEVASLKQELTRYKENNAKQQIIQNGNEDSRKSKHSNSSVSSDSGQQTNVLKNQTNTLNKNTNTLYSNALASTTDLKKLQLPSSFKSKRIAISGESAQNRFNKSNDIQNYLKEFEKTPE